MSPNNEFPEFPEFPTTFTEEDVERLKKLEEKRKVVEAVYKGQFAPGKWELKPAWEVAARRFAEAAYIPGWAGRGVSRIWESITPWTEVGFTPEQADVIKQEMEAELRELRRRELIVERLPKVKSYMETLALLGKLTGEEAQLYELMPELDPSKAASLELDEEERSWILEYNKALAGSTKEQLLEGVPFPSPETYEELMEQFEVLAPHDPRQAFATISFLKDYEEIRKAIGDMYPAKEGERTPEELAQDSVWKEMWERGLAPTGDIEKDIRILEESVIEERKEEGEPYIYITEEGTAVPLTKKEDGIYSEGAKVANIDPDTEKIVPLSKEEEYEVSNVPPVGLSGAGLVIKKMFPSLMSDEALGALRACEGDEKAIEEWWIKYIASHYGIDKANMNWVRILAEKQRGTYVSPTGLAPTLVSLYTEAERSYTAGWGDIAATAGGALRWLGADSVAEVITEAGRGYQSHALPDDLGEFHWGLLFNVRFWTTRGIRIVPFSLSLLPAAILGYYGGAAIAGAVGVKLGLGVFGTKVLTAIFGGIGGATLSRPMESALEAGAAYDRAKDMGATDEEADAIADEVFVNNLKLVGLDAVQIAAAFAPVSLKVGATLISRGLVRVATIGGRMFIVGLTEAGEEAYQEVVTRQALGEEVKLDAEMKQAMALGGAMGLGMGAGGDVLSNIINQTRDNMTPTQKQKFDADVEEVGEVIALDRFVETPEGAKLVEEVVEVVKEQQFNREIREPRVAPARAVAEPFSRQTQKALSESFERIPDVGELETLWGNWVHHLDNESLQAFGKLAEGSPEYLSRVQSVLREQYGESLIVFRGGEAMAIEGRQYVNVTVDKDIAKKFGVVQRWQIALSDVVAVGHRGDHELIVRQSALVKPKPPVVPEVQLQETPAVHGKKFDFIVNDEVVGSVDYRGTESLGIEGIMIVDIEVKPEMKRRGIATQVLGMILSEAETQNKPLYTGTLKPEGQLWLEGLERQGLIKLEKHEHKLLGYSISREALAKFEPKPLVRKKVHTKEMRFYKNQLASIDKELVIVRKSHRTHSERLESLKEAKAPAYDLLELQETLKNVEVILGELNTKKATLEGKIEAIREVEEREALPEEGIYRKGDTFTTPEGEMSLDFWVASEREWQVTKPDGTKTRMTIEEIDALVAEGKWKYKPIMIPVVPEIAETPQTRWDAQSLLDKIASASKAGIAKTAAKLSWNELTSVQQERLEASEIREPVITKEKVEKLSPQELSEGKAISKKIAEIQSRSLEGLPERTVDVGVLEQLREAAEAYFDSHLFAADMDNNLSKALVAAQKLGDIPSYVKYLDRLPKLEVGGIDWDATVSQDFKDAEFDDASMWNLNTMPFVDACAYIDKGVFGGALRMKVYQIGDQALVANFGYQGGWGRKLLDTERALGLDRPSWWKFRRKAAWNEMFYAISNSLSFEDVIVDASELLQRGEISEPIKEFSEKHPLSPEQQSVIVNYAKVMRMSFDEIWAEMNSVRAILGREPIEYLTHYLPEVYKTNVWGRFLGIHLKPDFLHEQALAPDFVKPSAPFNPRELERKGGLAGYEKVKDVRRLFLDYVSIAGREMFFTPAVNNAKAHARYLRNEKGLDVPAKYIEDRFLQTMVGVPESGSRWAKETIPPWIMNPLWIVRRRLNPAVFGLNPKWNLFIQTSSMALLPLKGIGVKSCIKGLQYVWNPAARKWVEDNVPASIIKERGRGSLVHQDVGTTLTEARRADMSPIETVDEWVTFITRKLERLLTGISAYAGHTEGQRRGITDPARLVAFASDAATTQSMYDPFHLPGAYSPMVRFLVPFQTFCFEALTKIREMSGIKKIAAGAYQTVAADSVEGKSLIRKRTKYFLEFMAAIFLVNVIGELFNNRKPWEWSSFVPAVNIMMYGVDPSNPWNKPFISQYAWGLWKGFDALIEYGNWKPLTYWATKWHFPAGFQAKRMIEGTVATIEGAHKDVSGEVMFELEEGEWLKAVTLGVWSTESGEEWIKTHLEGEDPTTQRIIKDIKKLEEQLGTSVEGKYYTLGKYQTESINLIRENKPDEPLWRILESAPIYPPLTLFAMHCEIIWEEYYNTPSGDRIAYRRANPYIDATLVFWEKVQNPRSDEGKEELGKLFRMFGVDKNPRWHHKGLPEIPEEFIGLPE